MSITYQSQEASRSDRFRRFLSSTPAYLAVIIIAFLWTLPTLGIFISSFRPPSDILWLVDCFPTSFRLHPVHAGEL